MQQPAFSGMDSLEFPELHEESVGVLAFSRNLYKMMRASGIHDFSLKVCLVAPSGIKKLATQSG